MPYLRQIAATDSSPRSPSKTILIFSSAENTLIRHPEISDFSQIAAFLHSSEVKLDDIITEEGETFQYLYDMKDKWQHEIVVEKILNTDINLNYPSCIGGESKCPPDYCGGIDGFYRMLQICKDKTHPNHQDTLRWLGQKFDIRYFNDCEVSDKLFRYWQKGNFTDSDRYF